MNFNARCDSCLENHFRSCAEVRGTLGWKEKKELVQVIQARTIDDPARRADTISAQRAESRIGNITGKDRRNPTRGMTIDSRKRQLRNDHWKHPPYLAVPEWEPGARRKCGRGCAC